MPTMESSDQTTRRIFTVAILFGVFVTGMLITGLYKVASLKIAPPEELLAVSATVSSTSKQLAKRGQLLDRRGRILAASRLGYSLFVDPSLVDDPELIALELGELLGLPPAEIERKIRSRPNSKYIVLELLLNDAQLNAMNNLNMKCVGIEQRLVREYPHGNIGDALIGMVGTEHTGLAGFENSFNERLLGVSGSFIRLRDTRRQTLWVSPEDFTPTQDGGDVQLSIDVVIQDIATSRLMEEIQRCNAGGGRLVVVDPMNGEVLAMVDILNPRDGEFVFTGH